MTLSTRMVMPILNALRQDRAAALRDPSVLALLVRERARLARSLAASAPNTPRLAIHDIMLLRALAEVHDSPVETVLDGDRNPGAVVRAARLRLHDGYPVVETGLAEVDDWGRLHFGDLMLTGPSLAPAPLAVAG